MFLTLSVNNNFNFLLKKNTSLPPRFASHCSVYGPGIRLEEGFVEVLGHRSVGTYVLKAFLAIAVLKKITQQDNKMSTNDFD